MLLGTHIRTLNILWLSYKCFWRNGNQIFNIQRRRAFMRTHSRGRFLILWILRKKSTRSIQTKIRRKRRGRLAIQRAAKPECYDGLAKYYSALEEKIQMNGRWWKIMVVILLVIAVLNWRVAIVALFP